MAKTTEFTTISISVDHVWAGSGKLVDGIISDCGAQFGADQDDSRNIYELIEEAIEDGKDSLKVEMSDRDGAVLVTWSIVEPVAPVASKIGDEWYSADGESEYGLRVTASGYAVVRGDGSYAEFLGSEEAEEAAEMLAKGEKSDNDYEWNE